MTTIKKVEKKKQIQARFWSFTLNNYDNDDIYTFENIFKHECNWYVFQEEIGENGTPHLQGTLSMLKVYSLTGMKKICGKSHWEPTKSIKGSLVYCQKEKSRNGKIYHWGINDIKEEVRVHEPYGWQLEIMDIIKEQPDERTIHWFWEPNGNVGKSSLTKYLVVKHNAIMISGKSSDIFHMIIKKIPKIVICDIPRINRDYVNIGALESVKNGLIFSGKYDSEQIAFNSPHVICFANQLPELEDMSRDRWNIVRIGDEPEIQPNIYEMMENL